MFTIPKCSADIDKHELACLIGAVMAGLPEHKDQSVKFTTSGYILSYYLCGGEPDDNLLRGIKKGLNHLKTRGFTFDAGKNCYCIDKRVLNISSFYIAFRAKDIRKIMTADFDKTDRFSVLQHYIDLLSTINNGTKISLINLEYFCERFNKSRAAAIKYNKILRDLNLISAVEGYSTDHATGRLIKKTAYCRPEDINAAKSYLFNSN